MIPRHLDGFEKKSPVVVGYLELGERVENCRPIHLPLALRFLLRLLGRQGELPRKGQLLRDADAGVGKVAPIET